MGGNVTALNNLTSTKTQAQKIPIKVIGRKLFVDIFVKIFKTMNREFMSIYNQPIWHNDKILTNGFAFNGSTSFVMDPLYSDEDILKYKPIIGDIDITVPIQIKEQLWNYLDTLQGKEIIEGARYMGSNKPTISSIGEQINSIIFVNFPNGKRVAVQVDFEFVPYENDIPTPWAKFSHGASFLDAKVQVKSVMHKFLIRALIGSSSTREDIVIATPKSTPENITLSKSKIHAIPKMLKFSVGKGVRVAYSPISKEYKHDCVINGKRVYRAINSKESIYETNINEIYKLIFQERNEPSKKDFKRFESFVGILSLMKKNLNKSVIQQTHDRFIQLLWGQKPHRGQELEVKNPNLDRLIKNNAYQILINELKIKDVSTNIIENYYMSYGKRSRKL
jgi:hypothetical protein